MTKQNFTDEDIDNEVVKIDMSADGIDAIVSKQLNDSMNALKEMYESTPPMITRVLCNEFFDDCIASSFGWDKPKGKYHADLIKRLTYFSIGYRRKLALEIERQKQLNHGSSDGGYTYDAEFIQKIVDKNSD